MGARALYYDEAVAIIQQAVVQAFGGGNNV
jgi:hypothetical protein